MKKLTCNCIFLSFLIVALSCNNKKKNIAASEINNQKTNSLGKLGIKGNIDSSDNTKYFKKIIKENKLEKILEDAKWRMYAMYCDSIAFGDSIKYIDSGMSGRNSEKIRMGELDLEILMIRLDTFRDDLFPLVDVELSLVFVKKNAGSYTFAHLYNKTYSYGEFWYNKTTPEIPLAIRDDYGHAASLLQHIHHSKKDSITRSKIRVLNPMQPEVIYYVRENANKVNTWFLSEAERRGIFDSVKYPPANILQEINANKKMKQIPLSESLEIRAKYRDQVKPKHE